MTNFKLLGSSLTIAMVSASAVFAATTPPEYVTTLGALTGPATVANVGTAVITQTGDNTVSPYQNTIVSTQQQTSSTSGAGNTSGFVTITGVAAPQFQTLTVSGTGTQNQATVQSQVNQYDPLNVLTPPTVVSTATVTTPSGSPTVTAVSATGFTGSAPRYSSTLTTSGTPSAAGAVVATENSTLLNSAGIAFEQRIGTATYNVGTGAVAIALPQAATSSTSLSASGLTTTGTVSAATVTGATVNAGVLNANVGGAAGAAGINAGNGRITNLSAGTGPSDAVNYAQLTTTNANVTALGGRVTTLESLVSNNRLHADRGIATAVALSGGAFLPNKKINLTVNVGGYESQAAVAAQVGILVSENIAINAGVSTSLKSDGGTAYRGGITFGF